MLNKLNISKTFFVFDLDDTIYKEYNYEKSGIKFILKSLKNLGFNFKFKLNYLMSIDKPFQYIMRAWFDKFVYRNMTKKLEQKLVHDTHYLYDHMQKFLNIYKGYRLISEAPTFQY